MHEFNERDMADNEKIRARFTARGTIERAQLEDMWKLDLSKNSTDLTYDDWLNKNDLTNLVVSFPQGVNLGFGKVDAAAILVTTQGADAIHTGPATGGTNGLHIGDLVEVEAELTWHCYAREIRPASSPSAGSLPLVFEL